MEKPLGQRNLYMLNFVIYIDLNMVQYYQHLIFSFVGYRESAYVLLCKYIDLHQYYKACVFNKGCLYHIPYGGYYFIFVILQVLVHKVQYLRTFKQIIKFNAYMLGH